MDPILHLPLEAIAADALPRDRTLSDPDAQQELVLSIVASGLRQPIEVWELSEPRDGHTHGLISGHRRLAAFRHLAALRGNGDFATIPAFQRRPESYAGAMAAMIAENEIRAPLSPWEKGRILVACVEEQICPTLDDAVRSLHPTLSRQRHARLRQLAHLVDELGDALAAPERLTLRQCLRLSAALRQGYEELIHATLREQRTAGPEAQWSALLPVLAEAERGVDEDAETPGTPSRPGRPRRVLHLKQGLTIHREISRGGWILRFSGPEARRGGLIDDVLDEVERLFGVGR